MQVEEKNRQLNEDAETIEEKNELQTGKKKHRKNNFAAGMAVGAAAAIMGCSLAGIYFSRHYRYSSLATAYSSRGTKTATSSTVESQNQKMSGQLYIFLSRCSTQIKESCSRITSGKTLKMSLMRKKNGKIINLLIKKFVILNGLIL